MGLETICVMSDHFVSITLGGDKSAHIVFFIWPIYLPDLIGIDLNRIFTASVVSYAKTSEVGMIEDVVHNMSANARS